MDVQVDGDGTIITVAGTRDAAVVVVSASGEEIYLPPEDFADQLDTMTSPVDSPYETVLPADDPYQPASSYERTGDGRTRDVVGMESTDRGFRIIHPEPAYDVRFIRADPDDAAADANDAGV